jgi:tetratricopeptide (TPR) repeat protein
MNLFKLFFVLCADVLSVHSITVFFLCLFAGIISPTILHARPVLSAWNTASLAAVDSALQAEANKAFQQQAWAAAATRYQAITNEEPTNGMAWFRFASALHNAGKHRESVEPYNRAIALGFQSTTATFCLARVYAVLKSKQGVIIEPDFDNIRTEARLAPILVRAEQNLTAFCNAAPEYRQFDFWLGEWDVRPYNTPNALPNALSVIERINGDCTILENYYTKAGYVGKSFNSYDAAQSRWRQFWNDNTGAVLEFVGEYDATEKAIKYRSETVNRRGQKQLGKMTFYNLGKDKTGNDTVRQFWEISTDDGKTWSAAFDGLYTRRK